MNRFYKPLLIGITGLIVVMLAFSMIMPSRVMTSKWVRVAQDKDSVINVIKDLNTWKDWNGLLGGAEGIRVQDSLLTWKTSNGNENSIRLESVQPNGVSAPISLNGGKYFNSGFSVEKRSTDSVQVVWYIIEDLKWYPWEKFYGMMAADMKGPLMQKSLDDLKTYLDNKQ
ncbi:MAG TPA: hypothetical protein VK166_02090 [Chitinophagaceae bacterium]|nr:hypothetical protein [Chitinophagaceae bacterium]